MQKKNYDYIVLGCGGIGSGAAYWLARRAGADVLGLEQFELGHHQGGSQDYSRMIRHHGYMGDYLQMTPYTYAAWATVEQESVLTIVTKTGGVELHTGDNPRPRMDEQAAAMAEAGIAFVLDALPEHPQILVCIGSGHAFKFASLLGKILSELAIDGRTEHPIASFTLQRKAIMDPNFTVSPMIQKIRDRKR